MASATAEDLKVVERLLEGLDPEQRQGLADIPQIQGFMKKWRPSLGRQEQAYNSKADCLLYGGEPGGGKSFLILLLAFNEHRRSFVMRREYGELERLIEDALIIHGSKEGYNGSPPPRLRISDDQTIYFRAAQHVGDEKRTMGQGRDLLGIDEACDFTEGQVRFMMGWVRTEVKGQRCRTVLATNPPTTAQGYWIIKMFAPWIDDTYPNPLEPGELGWVLSDEDGNDEWVDGPDCSREINGNLIRPTSRTYIPASTKDNPYYVDSDYERNLWAMKEPYRSILMGGFQKQTADADNQVIPTDWIKAAMDRWKPDGWKDYEMTAMALDPAGGGADAAALAWRHRGWYAPIFTMKGKQTASGSAMAALVVSKRRANAPVVIDMGGGYGSEVMTRLKDNGIVCLSFKGSETSTIIATGGVRYYNKRAEAWWKFREELNPDQEGGSVIALPDDQELLADLASPTFEVPTRGILIEEKSHIKARLGRSPDKGDAVVMCLAPGNQAIKRQINTRNPLKVLLGYAHVKKGFRK